MEPASRLLFFLLCASFFSVPATASLFPPFLRDAGSVSAAASAAAGGSKPLAKKPEIVIKYKGKLRPTKINGKMVGDSKAWRKFVMKALKHSDNKYYGETLIKAMNLKNGGSTLGTAMGTSCNTNAPGPTSNWKNITSTKSKRKRYSFEYTYSYGPETLVNIRSNMQQAFVNG